MSLIYSYHYMMNANDAYPEDYGLLFHHINNGQVDLIHIINSGFVSVAEAINSSGGSTLNDGFILALAGAFSAFAFNLIQKMIDAKSVRLTKSGDAMLLLIKEFEKISIPYWIKGFNSTASEEQSNCHDEINIKAMLMTIDKNLQVLILNLPMKNKSYNKQRLESFSSDIYDLASGGDFEADVRPANKTTAFAIAKKCGEAKAVILSLI